MRWRRGPNISESKNEIILINDVPSNFAIRNLLKQRLAHGASLDAKGRLDHHHVAAISAFGGETFAQVIDDLVAEAFAGGAPALAPGELFYAGAQALEADNLRFVLQL